VDPPTSDAARSATTDDGAGVLVSTTRCGERSGVGSPKDRMGGASGGPMSTSAFGARFMRARASLTSGAEDSMALDKDGRSSGGGVCVGDAGSSVGRNRD
jgi:hypothetical protein